MVKLGGDIIGWTIEGLLA